MQSLLAICAMMIASLFALSVHKSVLNSRMTIYRAEIETQAAMVGTDMLSHIGAQPFDRALLDQEDFLSEQELLGELTTLPFPVGRKMEQAEAIEDFHKMVPLTVETFKDGKNPVMTVTAEVRYVYIDPVTRLQQVSATPTLAKEVTVFVEAELLPQPIVLSRVFTYP